MKQGKIKFGEVYEILSMIPPYISESMTMNDFIEFCKYNGYEDLIQQSPDGKTTVAVRNAEQRKLLKQAVEDLVVMYNMVAISVDL